MEEFNKKDLKIDNEEKLLREEKWKKLFAYRYLFKFIPFLNFALVAGSLAYGKIHENSDFDVIIGARPARIFTVRFFCFLVFGLAGVRRAKIDHKETARNKICLNHFVTPTSYQLQPPYNIYWEKLYQNLVPIYGKEAAIRDFFRANDFLIKGTVHNFQKFKKIEFNFLRNFWEFMLGGSFGNSVESFLKQIQLRQIRKNLPHYGSGFAPRLRFDDDELEFHPDTARIESIIKRN